MSANKTVKKQGFIRGAADILCIAAIILAFAAYFLYRGNGINEFSPQLSQSAIIWTLAGAAVCLAGLLLHSRLVRFAAYLMLLYAFLGFINAQITYIANVFVSIDGNTFTPGFIMTAVSFVLAIVTALLSAVLIRREEDTRVPASVTVVGESRKKNAQTPAPVTAAGESTENHTQAPAQATAAGERTDSGEA